MAWRVIYGFFDAADDLREYRAGETYPRPGLTPPPARLDALAGNDNVMGRPLIAEVDEPKPKRRKKVKPE